MLTFNTLLEKINLDPKTKTVFLLRHEDKKVSSPLYQVWKSAPQNFEAYQSRQKWKNRFPEGSRLAAFVVGPEGETLFVGLYDVLKLSRIDGEYDDQLLGKMPPADRSLHETKHSALMRDYEEKLVIDWGKGRNWRQKAHEQNNKTILEIRARPREKPFPPYVNFLHHLGDLRNIWPSWQTPLKRKGVYLLTFDDGMQYVGSATGEDGFWQRWQDYLATGHGGNRILKRDKRDARKAMVSILEVSGSAQNDRDIINQEMLWQLKLGTRAKRLEKELP